MSFNSPIVRKAEFKDAPLFKRRHTFNREFQKFKEWFDNRDGGEYDEIWEQFVQSLATHFYELNDSIWLVAVHPLHRKRVAEIFCEVAHAKLQLDPNSDPTTDTIESRLWSAALQASPLGVVRWESQVVEKYGELGYGFSTVKHRLADLYRRAGRVDGVAIRLYASVFVGPQALPISHTGAGAQNSIGVLLERGAALSVQSSLQEAEARYTLCLLLWLRGWTAPWVLRSIEIARQKLPDTVARRNERLGQLGTPYSQKGHSTVLQDMASEEPKLENSMLEATPNSDESLEIARQKAIAEVTAILESNLSENQTQQPEIELEQKAATEVTKRKRGRPRKKVAEDKPDSSEESFSQSIRLFQSLDDLDFHSK